MKCKKVKDGGQIRWINLKCTPVEIGVVDKALRIYQDWLTYVGMAAFKDVAEFELVIVEDLRESVELAHEFDDPRFLIPQEPKIDKMAIKKALKDGEEIKGAILLEKQNIQIK